MFDIIKNELATYRQQVFNALPASSDVAAMDAWYATANAWLQDITDRFYEPEADLKQETRDYIREIFRTPFEGDLDNEANRARMEKAPRVAVPIILTRHAIIKDRVPFSPRKMDAFFDFSARYRSLILCE